MQGLRTAFIPRDVSNRYMAQFLATKQGAASIDDYTTRFRRNLLLAGDVSDRVALVQYVSNLQP